MAYDRSDWHYDSTDASLPEDERWKRAGLHIAVFLKWLAQQDMLAGADSDPAQAEAIEKLKEGKISGSEYLEDWLFHRFWKEDVSDKMANFVDSYYGDGGFYSSDFEEFIGDSVYKALERDVEFDGIKKLIDRRYGQFLLRGPSAVQAQKKDGT